MSVRLGGGAAVSGKVLDWALGLLLETGRYVGKGKGTLMRPRERVVLGGGLLLASCE